MSGDDRSAEVLAVAVTFITLTWLIVSLRVFCRTVIIRSFGLDDILMCITQVLFTIYITFQLLGWRYGTGQHRKDLTREENTLALRYWFICELFYIATATMLKVAVGFFLLRISILPAHIWLLRILMIGSVLFATVYAFMVIFQCNPVTTFWEMSPGTEGKCWGLNIVILTYIASGLNCAADWSFGILPGFIVYSLKMNTRKKFIVILILGFAAIGSTATIVRMFYVPTLLDGDDFLWATTDVAIWSTVEPGIGITAASIATLRPLWQAVTYKLGLSPHGPASATWQARNRRYNPSDGYMKTDDVHTLHRIRPDCLRPDKGVNVSTISGPGTPVERKFRYLQSRSSTDSFQLAQITKTVEVSLSTAAADGSGVGETSHRSLPDLERGVMGSRIKSSNDDTGSADNILVSYR